MKVWKARLSLVANDEMKWCTHFRFELQEKDYVKINKYYVEKGREWSSIHIPINMEYSRFYDSFKIEQGFERELNEDELKALEAEMKNKLIETLIMDKDYYISEYEQKMKAVKGE